MIEEYVAAPKAILDKLKGCIDLAISEIRSSSKEYVTPPPEFRLKEVIEDLINSFNENEAVKTVFHCDISDALKVDEQLKLNIYRTVQEQTNNTIKYANASAATIFIKEPDSMLQVLISDNGQGCNLKAKRKALA